MKLALIARIAALGLSASALAVALAFAYLLVELSRSDGLVRYPAAERLSATHFRLDTLTRGYVSQSGSYLTTDDSSSVLSWYARHHGAGKNEGRDAMGSCQTLTAVEEQQFLQEDLAVTICPESTITLVFVNRSLVLRR